jgi:hypothetical protein
MTRPSFDRSVSICASAVLGALLLSVLPLQGGGLDAPKEVPSGAQARPQFQGRPLAMAHRDAGEARLQALRLRLARGAPARHRPRAPARPRARHPGRGRVALDRRDRRPTRQAERGQRAPPGHPGGSEVVHADLGGLRSQHFRGAPRRGEGRPRRRDGSLPERAGRGDAQPRRPLQPRRLVRRAREPDPDHRGPSRARDRPRLQLPPRAPADRPVRRAGEDDPALPVGREPQRGVPRARRSCPSAQARKSDRCCSASSTRASPGHSASSATWTTPTSR